MTDRDKQFFEHQKARVNSALQNAISTMRHACDDAERRASYVDKATAISDVLHSLSWGFANASTSLEIAVAALNDAHIAALAAKDAQGEQP